MAPGKLLHYRSRDCCATLILWQALSHIFGLLLGFLFRPTFCLSMWRFFPHYRKQERERVRLQRS
ncbi:hypothetical protein ACJX0J_005332, partial [Zea mays]